MSSMGGGSEGGKESESEAASAGPRRSRAKRSRSTGRPGRGPGDGQPSLRRCRPRCRVLSTTPGRRVTRSSSSSSTTAASTTSSSADATERLRHPARHRHLHRDRRARSPATPRSPRGSASATSRRWSSCGPSACTRPSRPPRSGYRLPERRERRAGGDRRRLQRAHRRLSPVSMDSRDYPEPPAAGPRIRQLDGAGVGTPAPPARPA